LFKCQSFQVAEKLLAVPSQLGSLVAKAPTKQLPLRAWVETFLCLAQSALMNQGRCVYPP
jgi:hypothetical protein